MENYPIKSVTFGGFDKQDVIQYIERTAEQAAAEQKALQEENDALRDQNARLTEELSSLRTQLDTLTTERAQLQESLSAESARRQELEKLKPLEAEAANLRREAEALRPNAEAYTQFKDRMASIEFDARKRTAVAHVLG